MRLTFNFLNYNLWVESRHWLHQWLLNQTFFTLYNSLHLHMLYQWQLAGFIGTHNKIVPPALGRISDQWGVQPQWPPGVHGASLTHKIVPPTLNEISDLPGVETHNETATPALGRISDEPGVNFIGQQGYMLLEESMADSFTNRISGTTGTCITSSSIALNGSCEKSVL